MFSCLSARLNMCLYISIMFYSMHLSTNILAFPPRQWNNLLKDIIDKPSLETLRRRLTNHYQTTPAIESTIKWLLAVLYWDETTSTCHQMDNESNSYSLDWSRAANASATRATFGKPNWRCGMNQLGQILALIRFYFRPTEFNNWTVYYNRMFGL